MIAFAALAALSPSPTSAAEEDTEICRGHTGDVIAACTRVINSARSTREQVGDAYINRGQHYYENKEYDRAIADFDRAIPLKPRWLQMAYGNRGNVYYAKHEYDKAIDSYDKAIALDQNYTAALTARGLLYEEAGAVDRAKADYEAALAARTVITDDKWGKTTARRHLATIEQRAGNLERAKSLFDEILREDPQDAAALNSRCWVLAHGERDLPRALTDCNESLRLQPGDADTLNTRGLVQLKLGAFDKAIADYDAAIATNPKDADSLYGRGVAKLRKGDAAGGNADIAAAKAIKSDIAAVYAGYGITVDTAGANSAPTPSTAAAADCALAETHWKSADEIKTVEVYEEHLKHFPNCPFAGLARARIEALKHK